ncbi:MAG TPA: hypothetical protein VKY41_10550 [Xanthomarina sp.]|nr:hypothetical protein [Xanthomarina sp.]
MNKQQPIFTNNERILDFISFILLWVGGLNGKPTLFFYQNRPSIFKKDKNESKESVVIDSYLDYLKETIKVEKIFNNKDNQLLELDSLTDLLPSEEQKILASYIDENYIIDEKYHDFNLVNYSVEDLNRDFKTYRSFYEINQEVLISYLLQEIYFVSRKSFQVFDKEVSKIDRIYELKKLLHYDLSKEYIEYKSKKYKEHLFEVVDRGMFMLRGFSDNEGIFIDHRKTLVGYLLLLKGKSINYDLKTPNVKDSYVYLNYEYFNFKLNGKVIENDNILNNELNELHEELNIFKNKNTKLFIFLEEKGFSENEIDTIINTFFSGKYTDLGLRYIDTSSPIIVFHFLFLFYIFDFYELDNNNLKSSNDFDKVLECQTLISNQGKYFRRYYLNIEANYEHRDYPFRSVEDTIKKIIDELKIEGGKLKSIPEQNIF